MSRCDANKGSLTVFFEEPFWIGVFERIEDRKLSACKVTFGARDEGRTPANQPRGTGNRGTTPV